MRKKLYICDKKPGACKGWGEGWETCQNEMCFHTSNRKHRKYRYGRTLYYKVPGSACKFQVKRVCRNVFASNCPFRFENIWCINNYCVKVNAPKADNMESRE